MAEHAERLPEPVFPHEDEGRHVAGWTSTTVITIGAAIMCVATLLMSWPIFIGGAVVIVLGMISAKVLTSMGYGSGGNRSADHPH